MEQMGVSSRCHSSSLSSLLITETYSPPSSGVDKNGYQATYGEEEASWDFRPVLPISLSASSWDERVVE